MTAIPAGVQSYARKIDAVATAMGTPPMPWQREASQLLGAVHPDGRMVFPFVVITVPRQAGKTTIVLATAAHRCLYNPNRRVWYTAETGKKARDKWGEMLDGLELEANPLAPLIRKTKRSNGDELLQWVNGSTFNPFPPTRDGLHSKQSDLVEIDEGFAHTEAEGAAILAGAIPTMATRHARQIVVLSTMGDALSAWFHNLVDFAKGDADPDETIAELPRPAILDYGVPEGTDPDDLDTIAAHHPAYGYTIDHAALADARGQFIAANGVELGRAEFLRAYGNLRSGSRVNAIPPAMWERAESDVESAAAPVFGMAVGPDGAHVAIVAGWHLLDGSVLVEVVEVRPGTGWAPYRLVELCEQHRATVAADRGGPAGPIMDEFDRLWRKRGRTSSLKTTIVPITRTDYAIACAEMRQRITEPAATRWRWRAESPEIAATGLTLSAAVSIAARRMVGDGSWVWDRRGSAGSVATLEAATLAGWVASRAPAPKPKPRVYVPG